MLWQIVTNFSIFVLPRFRGQLVSNKPITHMRENYVWYRCELTKFLLEIITSHQNISSFLKYLLLEENHLCIFWKARARINPWGTPCFIPWKCFLVFVHSLYFNKITMFQQLIFCLQVKRNTNPCHWARWLS